MASKRKKFQEEVKFKILMLINENSNTSTREIAKKVGISNGSAYYCLNALIEKGFIKYRNFKKAKNKSRYIYLLSPKGLIEKTKLTVSFLEKKIVEFEILKEEIKLLKEEIHKLDKSE